ncbi:MAG TPA: F0F1 ATP synthase subunit delta [Patescibacteria group bacterium]|nr:F0F1 ATP synthase subunit delta [Patescibacteria group bacterium]
MDNLDLSYFFKTKSASLDFSQKINEVCDSVYKSNFNLEIVLSEKFGMNKKDKFLEILRNNNVDISSTSAISDFFNKIIDMLPNIPVLSLTIAFEPTDKTLENVSEWFLLNLKRQVLLDFKIDKNILGGAIIFSKGKYLDYSIRSRFDASISDIVNQNNTENKLAPETPVDKVQENVNSQTK